MEIKLSRQTERSLTDLAEQSGRALDELVEDALAGYLADIDKVRQMIEGRYRDLKSGHARLIDAEEALARLKANTEAQRRARS